MPSRIAVIGKGLFGVAASRHLARSGWDTTVIGPDEPPVGSVYDGPHGAHFDEGRIMVARGDTPGVDLTLKAIEGMRDLEAATGARLLVQSGTVEIEQRGREGSFVDGVINAGVGARILETGAPQGYYNPRSYLRAALDDLVAAGGTIVPEPVEALARTSSGWDVTLGGGNRLAADLVVVAAGAWCNQLLERPLALRLKREHVIFAKLDAAQATSIAMRPAVFHGRTGSVADVYILPPLQHPDGSWYLKLGANTLHDQAVSWDDIDSWYRTGDSDVARDDLIAAFGELLPQVEVSGFHTERCVITYTPHGRPFVDRIGDGLFICGAGNGHGASWAEGAGMLVAALVNDEGWDGPAPEVFRAVHDDEDPHWPQALLLRDRAS